MKIMVTGAGLMGHGIAQTFLASGFEVVLHDPDEMALMKATQGIRHINSRLGIPCNLDRLRVDQDLASAATDVGFVIEAAPESLRLKREIFSQLCRVTSRDTVLATNTSSIPVSSIASDLQEAERIVGTHFWNPPWAILLVEVVQGPRTGEAVIQRTMDLLKSIRMKPVLVKRDIPGFIGNRLQHALKREAIALVAEGVCDAETVDDVVKTGFGPRMAALGPLEQSDLVGLDLTLAIHEVLMPELNNDAEPSPILIEKVAKGELGMKSGKGFRTWTEEEANAVRNRLHESLIKSARTRLSEMNESA